MYRTILFLVMLPVAACAQAQSTNGDGSQITERFFQADANGDGFLSRSEAPSRLDFNTADTNGDGVLSLEEVQSFTRALR